MLVVYVVLYITDKYFEKKFFCTKNGENGPKIIFFEFIGKFSLRFFLNLVYKESLYNWEVPGS